ncbi:hypothetical protein BN1080_00196 [Planococcus massiliensis]|uniref:Uncharacterized protein n=1 Tax=Planococcus massiliensis TaxID=1499687 RepID=A0A098EG63_9BACL|nr:hypothetical protein BN1080_00196 [Planococcus massiliensis]
MSSCIIGNVVDINPITDCDQVEDKKSVNEMFVFFVCESVLLRKVN